MNDFPPQNILTDSDIHQLVAAELHAPTLGVTAQYLGIHQPVYEKGILQISKINRQESSGEIVAYFPVDGQRFHFAMTIDSGTAQIVGLHIEAEHRVYFCVTSEELDFPALKDMTKLEPTNGWSKGDQMRHGNSNHTFSALHLEMNEGPDAFENKLRNLLDFLESDRSGILELVTKADASIQVVSYFHNGNSMLGGQFLNPMVIRRLADLGLGIEFDLYAEGNLFS